jgi:hypothetical protein
MGSRMKALTVVFATFLTVACGDQGPNDDTTEAGNSPDAVQCDRPFRPREGCEEAACKAVDCGSPTSFLDENLCERAWCERQEDCLPEEECRELQYFRPSCDYLPDTTGCTCGSLLIASNGWFCMPRQSP